jgi:hypothetical protein
LPYGHIFIKVAQAVPIFLVFRSPYYKFTLATLFAYSFLISITVSACYLWLGSLRVVEKLKISILGMKIKVIPVLFVIIALGGILVYSYPMLTGHIIPQRTKMFTLHLQVPDYVYEAADYLDAQEGNYRVLSLPKENLDTYTWGYGAPTNILNLLSTTPVVWGSASYGGEGQIGNIFYSGLYDDALVNLEEIARLLNVKYLLLRNDCWYDFYGPMLSPEELTSRIQKNLGLKVAQSFGAWDFYELTTPQNGIVLKDKAFLIFGTKKVVSNLASRDFLKERVMLFYEDNTPQVLNELFEAGALLDCIFYNKQADETQLVLDEVVKGQADSVSYIYETSSLPFKPSSEFKLPDYIKVDKMVGLAESSSYDELQGWFWLLTNKQPNIFIDNLSGEDQLVNFSFETFSFMLDRTLYVYLNDDLLDYPMCTADTPQQIRLKRITLKPGRNIISFYTPYPQTTRRAREVTFAFKDFNIGGLEFSGNFYLPKSDTYKLLVYPVSKEDSHLLIPKEEQFIMLDIDGKKHTLDLTKDFVYINEKIDIEAGRHTFKIGQFLAEDYNIEILSSKLFKGREDIDKGLDYKMVNPAQYSFSLSESKTGYISFNESYDRNWKLYQGGKARGLHLQGDGYNNTWYVQKMPAGELVIEFWPQRLLGWGAGFSGLAVILGLVYLLKLKMKK